MKKISSNSVILKNQQQPGDPFSMVFPLFLLSSIFLNMFSITFAPSLQPRLPSPHPITLQFFFFLIYLFIIYYFLIYYQSPHSTPLSNHGNGRNNNHLCSFPFFLLNLFFSRSLLLEHSLHPVHIHNKPLIFTFYAAL